VAGNNKITRL